MTNPTSETDRAEQELSWFLNDFINAVQFIEEHHDGKEGVPDSEKNYEGFVQEWL